MKISTCSTWFHTLLAGALLCAVPAGAQELLQLKFQATCQTTNDAGQPVKEIVNNQKLIQDYADLNGVTNARSLALVYHVNGDERGDVIQIVDAGDATVLSHVYGLFFPVDLPSGDGSQLQRFAYVYNSQQAFSMGSAMLREKILIDRSGATNRVINGNIQFYLNADGSNGLRLCTGTIVAAKRFITNAPPVVSTNAPGGGGKTGTPGQH